MDSNELYIDTSIMDKYSSITDDNINRLDNTKEETTSNFSSLIDNGIYTQGFNKIASRLDVITNTLNNTKNINRNYIDKFIALENKGVSLANDIEIPVIDHSRSVSINDTFNSTSLNKEDGTSVNNGNKEKTSTMEDKYKSTNTKLTSIDNDKELEESVLKLYTDIDKKALNSITKEDNITELLLEDYDLLKSNLNDINKKDTIKEIDLDEYIDINKINLSNINKGA